MLKKHVPPRTREADARVNLAERPAIASPVLGERATRVRPARRVPGVGFYPRPNGNDRITDLLWRRQGPVWHSTNADFRPMDVSIGREGLRVKEACDCVGPWV